MLKFDPVFFVLTALLFLVELYIGFCVHDEIVRPYVGDFLVVILIYCFIMSFLNARVLTAAVYVLLFSYLVEISQYFKLVEILGLQRSRFASTIMGTCFAWADMIIYTAGIAVVLFIELKLRPHQFKHRNVYDK